MATRRRRFQGPTLLRGWRKTLGITQQQAAMLLDLDVAAVCAFETGYKTPGLERAEKIESATSGRVPIDAWPNPMPRGRRAS